MADDLFEDVLDIEDRFYQEGVDAGVADGTRAGVIEGRIFGIEKGYDKALELGRLHGRALVWQHRRKRDGATTGDSTTSYLHNKAGLADFFAEMSSPPKGARLDKNIDTLLSLTDPNQIATENNDESVERIEDLTVKATNKARVIANALGEQFDPTASVATSIEDSIGLTARH